MASTGPAFIMAIIIAIIISTVRGAHCPNSLKCARELQIIHGEHLLPWTGPAALTGPKRYELWAFISYSNEVISWTIS